MNSAYNYKNKFTSSSNALQYLKNVFSVNIKEKLNSISTGEYIVLFTIIFVLILFCIYIVKQNNNRTKLERSQTEPVYICNIFGKCNFDGTNGMFSSYKAKKPYEYRNALTTNITPYAPLSTKFTTTRLSVSFWIRVHSHLWNQYPDWKHILHIGNMPYTFDANGIVFGVLLHPKQNNMMITSNEDNIQYDNFELDKWINVCVVVNDNNLDLYINGKLHRTITKLHSVEAIPHPKLYIANSIGGNKVGFGGDIVFVQCYSKSLTPNEVLNSYKIYNKYIKRYIDNKSDNIHYYNSLMSSIEQTTCDNKPSVNVSKLKNIESSNNISSDLKKYI